MTDRPDALVAVTEALPSERSVTDRYVAAKTMEQRAFNPISKLIDLYEEIDHKNDDAGLPMFVKERITILSTLGKYYAPQPKAIDIHVQSESKYTIEAVSFAALAEERQKFIPEQSQYHGPKLADVIEISLQDNLGGD